MNKEILLSEFDSSKEAIINPSNLIERVPSITGVAVCCFSSVLFNKVLSVMKHRVIGKLSNTNGEKEIYEIEYRDSRLVFFMMGVGAPLAAMDLEDVHAMGVDKFVVFGNCGVLDGNISDCAIIIPDRAFRDEGVSYHYQEARRDILLNTFNVDLFLDILDKNGIEYVRGATWTTDAFYRETCEKVKKRISDGALVVEMEAAGLQAVANFRGIDLNIFFYAGDNLSGDTWDMRSLSGYEKLDEKSRIALLALEWGYRISKKD